MFCGMRTLNTSLEAVEFREMEYAPGVDSVRAAGGCDGSLLLLLLFDVGDDDDDGAVVDPLLMFVLF